MPRILKYIASTDDTVRRQIHCVALVGGPLPRRRAGRILRLRKSNGFEAEPAAVNPCHRDKKVRGGASNLALSGMVYLLSLLTVSCQLLTVKCPASPYNINKLILYTSHDMCIQDAPMHALMHRRPCMRPRTCAPTRRERTGARAHGRAVHGRTAPGLPAHGGRAF